MAIDKQAKMDCTLCTLHGLDRPKLPDQTFEVLYPEKELEDAFDNQDQLVTFTLHQTSSTTTTDTKFDSRMAELPTTVRWCEAWDNWIVARYHSFADECAGLRIPTAQLHQEFNHRLPGIRVTKRSLENHVQRSARLRKKRDQYSRSVACRTWEELRLQ